MNIDYYWKHIDSSPATENYANEKFSKLDKYIQKFISAHMTISLNGKTEKSVKLTLKGDGETVIGEETDPDIYAAIDKLEDKIARQVRRNHQKHSGH